MRGITLLDISETRITDEGIRYLAKSQHLINLVDLKIEKLDDITPKSLRLLFNSKHLCPFFNLQSVFETYVDNPKL